MTTCPAGVNYMHIIDHGKKYIEKNYERIQILTKEKLQTSDYLKYKISFNLMKKSLL